MEEQTKTAKGRPNIEFTVDGETYSSEEREITMEGIVRLAEKDAATHYLVEIRGQRERHEYKEPDQKVKIHPGSKFVTVFTGTTPVS
jgi:hypothetical protein